MKQLLFATMILLVLAPCAIQGQSTYVQVKVVDGVTKKPVRGAKVTFADPERQTAEYTATTNNDGVAKLRLAELPDNIVVTKPGYQLASRTVNAENVHSVIIVYAEQATASDRQP